MSSTRRTAFGPAAAVIGAAMLLLAPQCLAKTPTTPCGKAPSGGGASAKPVKASLSLDPESKDPPVVTDATFGRKTGTRKLTLVYTVKGCVLEDPETPEQPLSIYPGKSDPGKNVDPIPDDVVVVDGKPSAEGSRYIVRLKVSTSAEGFDPGAYSGLVEIKAGWLSPVRTGVTISRSENHGWLPLFWGAVGALSGFGLFFLTRLLKQNDLLVGKGLLIGVGLVSLVAGMVAAYTTSYVNQDVWVASENWWGALVVGFTGATSGVMVGLLSAVWSETKTGDSNDEADGT